MSRVASVPHEAVEIQPRRHMTYGEKHRRWEECGRVCTICGEPCAPGGPFTIWDHRVPLALGGTNDLSNMEPNHTGECATLKTRRDVRAIAKAKRLIRKSLPDKPPSRLRSRGFEKPATKRKWPSRSFSKAPP